MKIITQEHLIPARDNSPEITLGTRLVFQNEEARIHLPYLFILPGGPGSNHSYYADYDNLHKVLNLVYYDPRGCGLSEKGDSSTYTMNNYIEDLFVIKQQILGKRPAYILGKSYGAMCALLFALRYSNEVEKLILAAGTPTFTFLEKAKTNLTHRGNAEQKNMGNYLWQGAFKDDEHIAQFFDIMASLYSWKVRNNQPVNRPKPTHTFTADVLNEGFKNQLWKFDVRKKLKNIHCDTLILVGEEDWITDPIYSIQMAKDIPNSTLQIFKNADHSLESDVPELYFKAIEDFIA